MPSALEYVAKCRRLSIAYSDTTKAKKRPLDGSFRLAQDTSGRGSMGFRPKRDVAVAYAARD